MNESIYFTPAEVAQFSGVPVADLRQYEPQGWGSPRHFGMSGGQYVYTADGCRLLAQALSMAGKEAEGGALLEAVNKVEDAAKAPAMEKPTHPQWMDRKDLQ